ncbi:MAG: OmpA family protein [Bacteroidetes bacterium]|nr:OmpA family protein [Bacteroidota bacterium]
MTKPYLLRRILPLAALLGSTVVSAQTPAGKMGIEVNVGLREYLGDLGSALFFQKKPNYQGAGLNFGYSINPMFDAVVNFSAGDVGYARKFDWRTEPAKYQSFRANTADLTLGARFKLANGNILKEDSRIAPYLYGGFGGYYIHTNVRWGALNQINNHLTDMGAQLQGGLGINFLLTDKLGIKWSWTATYTMNDRWDGANNPAGSDPIATPLVNKSWKTNDMYGYHAIGISYAFGEGSGPVKGPKDKDNDGVPDKYDLCKNTPEKYRLYVDSVGCPADRDKDSILDADDACPDVWGPRKFNGCPDTDKDGIEDKLDKCPKAAGLAEFNGCPDSDGDGVQDSEDHCPNEAGLKEFAGCPDRDGDGVEDHMDKCPDHKGTIDGEGCPDTDGDGIYDHLDRCPSKPGVAANKGCPEIKVETKKAIEQAAKNIFFETNKDILKKESYDDVDKLVSIMQEYPEAKVTIEGHTDSDGEDAKNLDLSQRRADAVVAYMLAKGISPERMTAVGYGETKPKVPNTSVVNKALNRRVEIVVTF